VNELAVETIGRLASRLSRREVSPVDVVRAALEHVDEFDPLLRGFITVRADEALEAARPAERELLRGHVRGPLHGVPVAVKDNLAVAGWPTTNGSRLMAEHVTDYDATVVDRLRRAGAIILGKNNMHEWAMGGTCTGMYFGTVRNPWDPGRVPGGSSGGSAAAVSAGLAFAAIGTDGMGSIRTPASYCGVVGLKPTFGLVSRFGELPPTSSWLDHVGPITRDVADAAIVLSAIAGEDPADPTSVRPPADWAIDPGGLRSDITGLRIGLPVAYFLDDAVPAVRRAVESAATTLTRLGATVEEVHLPSLRHLPLVLLGAQTESQSYLLPLALEQGDGFASREIRNRILAAEFVRHADARRALQLRNQIRGEFRDVMARVDMLLTPTDPTPAFEIDAATVSIGSGGAEVDLRRPGGQSRLTTRLTLPFNVAGLPSLSLPAPTGEGELPIGLQLTGRRWHEAVLLRTAYALESATTGGYRVPPLLRAPHSEPGDRAS
jgi:aspartyl-tRNA(Asn)/glutamyl-tRNA(Gln) amidotransferase subunit A